MIEPMTQTIILGVIAELIGAGIIGVVGFVYGRINGRKTEQHRYRRRYENAVSSLSKSLGRIIGEIVPTDGDPTINARAIVSVRNGAREQLDDLKSLLNSDIDRLEQQIKNLEAETGGGKTAAPDYMEAEIRKTLAVLKKRWPEHSVLIDIAIRRLLAGLGLTEDFPYED